MSVTDSGPRAFDVTHARVLAIAGPMTLAHLTTPLLGIVGTAIIGQLGQAHLLGAVAVSAVVFDCIFWLFAFLRMGTVALTAQALGAADAIEQRAVLGRALLMAGAIGAGLLLLQQPIAWLAYEAMGASAAVTEAAKIYFFVRVWSAPLTLGNYAVLGWLIGLARTDLALALQVAINLANVAATALLVLALEMGVAGAALGTVLAEAVGLAAGLLLAWRLGRGEPRLAAAVVLDPGKLVRMLAVNRDIMIRTAALIVAFTFFMAQGARAGDTVLAANAVLYNLVLIGAFFLDGFATAAEQLCGRAVGARDSAAFRRAVTLSIGWGLGFAVAVATTFLAGGPQLIALMTASPEVRASAEQFLIFAVMAPLAGVLAYAFDGIYVGATWTRDMRNLMLASLALYFAAWWSLQPFGNAGLWGAILVLLGGRGILQALRYPALLRATFGPGEPATGAVLPAGGHDEHRGAARPGEVAGPYTPRSGDKNRPSP
jgi:MATE family multidrug resistance protein